MKPMISMASPTEDTVQEVMKDIGQDKPSYPYGLCLRLTDRELIKLGISAADLVTGGSIHLHAMARITNVSTNDGSMGKNSCVELQIEDMCCVESEETENEEAEAAMSGPMSRLYGKS